MSNSNFNSWIFRLDQEQE